MEPRRLTSTPRRPETVRVVIVGAGMAGLSAAEQLYKNGFTNITILEASNRIGGRIHTVHFGSRPTDIVELGGQYIGGESDDCSTYVLAKECGLIDEIKPGQILDRARNVFYTSDGKAIDLSISARAVRLFQSWYDESPPGHPTVEEYITKRYKQEISNHFNKERLPEVRCIFNNFLTYVTVDQGALPADVTMPPSEGYVPIPGGYIKVPGGMGKIVTKVAETIPSQAIVLQCEVDKISWENDPIIIYSIAGQRYQADHVIVTCPLGFLKSRHIFQPQLPVYKIKAIANLRFGRIGKIFLQYDQPFWNPGQRRIGFAWSNKEYSSKGYSRAEWWKGIEGVDTVFGNPKVLVFWVGSEGVDTLETTPEEELIDTCTSILRRFLGRPAIPRANRCLVSRWGSSPHTRGAYSYIGQGSGPEDMNALARPLVWGDIPKVLFAGEATSVSGQGFIHGARDSGIREANRILHHNGAVSMSKL